MKASAFMDNVLRFWSKVDRSGDCWLWLGERNNQGYGRFEFWDGGRRTRVLAHRLALRLAGCDLSDHATVLHACDNPPCVNPAHLTAGTQAANLRDAVAKGRADLSGLTADIEHVCSTCGTSFLGAPNRRYCDEHRDRKMRRSAA